MARGICGHHPGFTILELLFVIAIAGTLTAIAVPQGLRALDDFRTRAAARYLAQRIADARLSAIRRSASHGLRFERSSPTATATACALRRFSAASIARSPNPSSLAGTFPTSSSGSKTMCRMRMDGRQTGPTEYAWGARSSCR
jgi:prepilin-type N-terminal cleavage/methylation domain-containing protein